MIEEQLIDPFPLERIKYFVQKELPVANEQFEDGFRRLPELLNQPCMKVLNNLTKII